MNHYQAVATKALALAAVLDPRVPDFDEARVHAWADCFAGRDIFEAEALQAVRDHYSQPNPWPILPGNVIDRVSRMPVNSSPERVKAFIARWSNYPYSNAIQQLTGLDWTPTYPAPPGIHGNLEAEREFHRREMRQWIADNALQLVQGALDNKNPVLALEQ
ncbi:hypothetical protein GS982_01745 [Rhodococcus hoagii]|uniref:Uncharacterized protein n=1 Tax=Rhodococcus hoagii TaxID=43767 RepID=A0A9Q4ZIR4_RHOHA|nr:hypothetical protein [Prescottella equi]NKT77321.1 hypothetical protein [Prescottella equi]NKZ81108.1 hypothetical protein [Prescottella equi]